MHNSMQEEIVGKDSALSAIILLALFAVDATVIIICINAHFSGLNYYASIIVALGYTLFLICYDRTPISWVGVSEAGITEYYLGIKRQMISWTEVKAIVRDQGIGRAERGAIIILNGAADYPASLLRRSFYLYNNRPNVLYVQSFDKSAPVLAKYTTLPITQGEHRVEHSLQINSQEKYKK